MKCPKCAAEYDNQSHRMLETSTLCSSCYREGIRELGKLEAENKRLKDALEKIAGFSKSTLLPTIKLNSVIDIAYEALAGEVSGE